MKPILLFFSTLACIPGLFGQRMFLGKVVGEDRAGLPGVDISIEGGNPAISDDDGLFKISLSNEDVRRGKVKLIVPGYRILKPDDGEAVLPLSPDFVTEVKVKRTGLSQADLKIKELEGKIKKLAGEKEMKDAEAQSKLVEIESIKRAHQADFQKVSLQLDSLNKVIEKVRREGNEIEKNLGELVAQRKQLFYNDLSQTLLNYVDKLKNLRDWMPRISDVFLNNEAIKRFNEVVVDYNVARDSLNNKHKALETGVGLYWAQEKEVLRLEDIHALALTETHQGIVLQIVQQKIVVGIKDYATGKSSRPAAMRKAEKSAKEAESMLRVAIPKLEEKINLLLNSLR